jgi:hypothetical protein
MFKILNQKLKRKSCRSSKVYWLKLKKQKHSTKSKLTETKNLEWLKKK